MIQRIERDIKLNMKKPKGYSRAGHLQKADNTVHGQSIRTYNDLQNTI